MLHDLNNLLNINACIGQARLGYFAEINNPQISVISHSKSLSFVSLGLSGCSAPPGTQGSRKMRLLDETVPF